MKKFFKALTLVFMAITVCFSVVGCSLFGAITVDDAVANLEDAGYKVSSVTKKSELEKITADGFIESVGYVEAEISEYDYVCAYLYEEKSIANQEKEKFIDLLDDLYEQAVEDDDVVAKKAYKNFVVNRVGKWVVFGHYEAVKAFEAK